MGKVGYFPAIFLTEALQYNCSVIPF